MKKIFVIGLFFSSLIFTSCGEVDEKDTGLSFSVVGQGIVLPDTTTTTTCTGDDISGTRFSWSGINIKWADTNRDLRLMYMKIVINETGLGGEFTSVISDEVLGDVLQYKNGESLVSIGSGSIPAPDKPPENTAVTPRAISLNGNCRLHVTGLRLTKPDQNFSTTARITLFGIAVGNEAGQTDGVTEIGDETPVRAITTAKVVYNLN